MKISPAIRYVLFLLLFSALPNASYAADESCIKYEPTEKTLYGSIKEQTYTPASNSEQKSEIVWILTLRKSFCLKAKEGQKDISEVQLILEPDQYKTYAKYLISPENTYWLQVTGISSDATPDKHLTPVVLKVKDINRAPMS